MLLLHRYDKSKKNTYSWLINENSIIQVIGSRNGTCVYLDDGRSVLVSESLEEVGKLIDALREEKE